MNIKTFYIVFKDILSAKWLKTNYLSHLSKFSVLSKYYNTFVK